MMNNLLLLILIPLFGACFTIWARDDKYCGVKNIRHVSIWVMITEILAILHVCSLLDTEKNGIQLVEKYQWLDFPKIDVLLGADTFAMLLLLGINISFLISNLFLKQADSPKTLLSSELIFICLLNGYILAADIISFYIFFASASIPLIILVSAYGGLRKRNALVRFSIYNMTGALLLLTAIMIIYNYKSNNIPLNMAGNVNLKGYMEYLVWLGIFFAFISRMPIWPFHYWISSINATQRNPLVFFIGTLIPLIGLYGFMRFWPNTVPQTIAVYAPVFEIISVITMLVIALTGLSHKDFRYKLFAYAAIYYLLYLIGVFLPTGSLKMNIGYSLFSTIIIITVLSFLISYIEEEKKKQGLYSNNGILCYMPRTSICLSLFILAGIGLPITPLFWNNFIIISEILNYNLTLGVFVMASVFIVAITLLEELYRMKDKREAVQMCSMVTDLPKTALVISMSCLVVLFLSFIKPLWFVFLGG